jgi:membrane protein CcdC involved in cytochrome C biogenesis
MSTAAASNNWKVRPFGLLPLLLRPFPFGPIASGALLVLLAVCGVAMIFLPPGLHLAAFPLTSALLVGCFAAWGHDFTTKQSLCKAWKWALWSWAVSFGLVSLWIFRIRSCPHDCAKDHLQGLFRVLVFGVLIPLVVVILLFLFWNSVVAGYDPFSDWLDSDLDDPSWWQVVIILLVACVPFALLLAMLADLALEPANNRGWCKSQCKDKSQCQQRAATCQTRCQNELSACDAAADACGPRCIELFEGREAATRAAQAREKAAEATEANEAAAAAASDARPSNSTLSQALTSAGS